MRSAPTYQEVWDSQVPQLLLYAQKIINNWAQSQDIVVEVMEKFYPRHKTFSDLTSMRRFLFVSVKNGCRDFFKKTKSASERDAGISYVSEFFTIDGELEERELVYTQVVSNIYIAIEKMPAGQRKIWRMFMNGKGIADIAIELGVSIFTVRAQRARGLKDIRKHLSKINPSSLLLLSFVLRIRNHTD